MKKLSALILAVLLMTVSVCAQSGTFDVNSEEELYEYLHFAFPTAMFHIEKDIPLICVYEVQSDGTAKLLYYYKSEKINVLPDFIDGIPVTSIGTGALSYFFADDLIIPEGIRIIEDEAFKHATIRGNVHLPSSLEKIGAVPFSNLSSIEGNIVVSEANSHFTMKEDCLISPDEGRLIQYLGHKSNDTFEIPLGIRIIERQAFLNANFNKIFLPESVEEIRDGAFLGACERINIPHSLTKTGTGAFTGVDSIEVPETNTRYGLKDGILFDWADSRLIYCTPDFTASSYRVPEGIRFIDDEAFQYSSLTELYLPASVEQFSASALPMMKKTSVTLDPASPWFRQEDGIIYTGDYSRLVYYPRSNEQKDVVIDREIREIGDFAFAGAALQSLRLPRSLEKIGIAAFFGSSLDQLEIPDSVVSIGQLCFSLCREMRKLTIPAGVTEIGSSLFRYDDSLTVYVQSGSYAENYMKYGLYLDNYSTARVSYEIGT